MSVSHALISLGSSLIRLSSPDLRPETRSFSSDFNLT